jgi:small subunit ribosomal protein S1
MAVKDDFAEEMSKYEATFRTLDEGEIVEGEVIAIDKGEVIVDISYKSEGIIPFDELTFRPHFDPKDLVQVGKTIKAMVLKKEDEEGRVILSKKRADFEEAWEKLTQARERNGWVEGEVVDVVKGGLMVDLGLRGFLPASQVDLKRVESLEEFIGRKVKCKVLKMDRARKNVVVSRRAYLEEHGKKTQQEILAGLEVGQRLKGKVTNIANFGAFIDIGGASGLVHLSELSWCRVNHPSEVVSEGDEVEVEVLAVDIERGRLSLSLRSVQPNPWEEAAQKYQPGDTVKAKLTRYASFGAFLELPEGLEGLLHISEMDLPLRRFQRAYKVGDEVEVKILLIDTHRCRISFTQREVEEEPLVEEVEVGESSVAGEKVEVQQPYQDEKLVDKLVSSKEAASEPVVEGETEADADITLEKVLEEIKKSHEEDSE